MFWHIKLVYVHNTTSAFYEFWVLYFVENVAIFGTCMIEFCRLLFLFVLCVCVIEMFLISQILILLPLPIVHLICAYNSSLNVYTVPRVYTISREAHCTSCLIYIHFQTPSIFHRILYWKIGYASIYLLFEVIYHLVFIYGKFTYFLSQFCN